MKKRVFCIVFFFLLVASTPGFSAPKSSISNVEAILKQATTLHEKAIAIQGGWNITEKFIKKTKSLLTSGNIKKALEAVNEARDFAEQSVKQAETQKKNWSEPPYLK